MSAPMKIEQAWVEKAARKVARYNWGNEECWQEYQGEAREALSAVAPLIRAKALEEAAVLAEERYADLRWDAGTNMAGHQIALTIRVRASKGDPS